MVPKSQLCERARAWVSLRTDCELSELESALLDAHLGRCDACQSFAVGAERVARALRSARVQQPSTPLVVTPRAARRTGLHALQVVAAVAIVASAGVLAAFAGPSQTVATKPVSMVAGLETPDRLRELRRAALIGQGRVPVIPRNRLVPGEAV